MGWAVAHTIVVDRPEGNTGGRELGFNGAELLSSGDWRRAFAMTGGISPRRGGQLGKIAVSVRVELERDPLVATAAIGTALPGAVSFPVALIERSSYIPAPWRRALSHSKSRSSAADEALMLTTSRSVRRTTSSTIACSTVIGAKLTASPRLGAAFPDHVQPTTMVEQRFVPHSAGLASCWGNHGRQRSEQVCSSILPTAGTRERLDK